MSHAPTLLGVDSWGPEFYPHHFPRRWALGQLSEHCRASVVCREGGNVSAEGW